MQHLTLNCPQCRRRLVYVPLDGLTLYYRCDQHGALILKPLRPADDLIAGSAPQASREMPASDAA